MKVTVRAGGLAHGGEFVCELEQAQPELPRKKVFVRNAAPAELLEVEIQTEEKNLFRASLLTILETSADRIQPACPKFMNCGGCDLQHLSISAQREAKRLMVERALKFQGGLTPSAGVTLIGTELPGFNYRRRANFHLNEQGEIGFYKLGSGQVVDIDYCFLTSERINSALKDFRTLSKLLAPYIAAVTIQEHEQEIFYLLKLREGAKLPEDLKVQAARGIENLVLESDNRPVFSQRKFITEQQPSFPTGRFAQVNDSANKVLITSILAAITCDDVTELYAGSGNFSLPLASQGKNVTAVEADTALIEQGERNCAELNLGHKLTFIHQTCEKFARGEKFAKALLLDPPRSGAKEVVKHFSTKQTKQILYVSCSLPTLTRDLKVLVAKGFTLEKVDVLDMFPQTHHVETISHLSSKNFS